MNSLTPNTKPAVPPEAAHVSHNVSILQLDGSHTLLTREFTSSNHQLRSLTGGGGGEDGTDSIQFF